MARKININKRFAAPIRANVQQAGGARIVTQEVYPQSLDIRLVTATGQVRAEDALVLVSSSASVTLTLPTPASCTGYSKYIKRVGTGAVTINVNASETIDGQSSYSLSAQYSFVHLVSDGTNWHRIG